MPLPITKPRLEIPKALSRCMVRLRIEQREKENKVRIAGLLKMRENATGKKLKEIDMMLSRLRHKQEMQINDLDYHIYGVGDIPPCKDCTEA